MTDYNPSHTRFFGHQVDDSQTISFSFDNQKLCAHPGDTLASALIANDIHFVARSFKYHRPRGIVSAGSEEPSALVTLHSGAHQEPNTRASVVEVYDGLETYSQNYRGSLHYDLMAINDWLLSPFLGAGFYYKTFMWPKSFWEKIYEPAIRRSAGLGSLSGQNDPASYDHGYLHCDVLIIGSGASGLMAALTMARNGARIILADEDFQMGGRLNSETYKIDDQDCRLWAQDVIAELKTMNNVRLMSRTTIYGAYDHGVYGALERKTEHLGKTSATARQILWRIYSKHAILASGATERPIAFGNNDRPAIMLAGAVRAYANRWGVSAGKNISIFTNNDDGWRTAIDLHSKGVNISAVIDSRDKDISFAPKGIRHIRGATIVSTAGRRRLKEIHLSNGLRIKTDCLGVSGGWNPNIHLSSHHRNKPIWRKDIMAFVPNSNEQLPPGMKVIGAARGVFGLHHCLKEGENIAVELLSLLGLKVSARDLPKTEDEASEITALWHVKESVGRAWIDFQNDVTVKDIEQSHQEGFKSVEHLKRYTTLGMATDQGKTANVIALAVMAECRGLSIEDTGTTVFRPPYTPVPIGAFAGRLRGRHFRPMRLTPSHHFAGKKNAAYVEAGMWLRARWFVQPGDTHWRHSVDREVIGTRTSVGICDVSTLGKIDVQGENAVDFLNKVYTNSFTKLGIGKIRYGIMLREDGIVMDDGVVARFADNHFIVTTTTANAVNVFRHMEFCRQCLWPDYDVHLISTTEQFAQYAIAGPNARKLLQKIVDSEHDISNEGFPYMACKEITICGGVHVRLFRVSFSGELGYEIAVPTRYGASLIEILFRAGEEFNVVIYGTEALSVMRIEKGHAVGNELNGQTNARDLGLGKLVSKKKDCIGNILSERPELVREDRPTLMGFIPVNRKETLTAGSHFVSRGKPIEIAYDEGWLSSESWSPELGHSIGLGFIKRGHERVGEIVVAVDLLRGKEVLAEIVSPHMIDAKGERLRV